MVFSGSYSFPKKYPIFFLEKLRGPKITYMLKKGKKIIIMRFTAGYGSVNYSKKKFGYIFQKLHDPLNPSVS